MLEFSHVHQVIGEMIEKAFIHNFRQLTYAKSNQLPSVGRENG